MPFGGMLSLGAAGISAGSGLLGLINGSPASQVQLPSQYNYANMPGADTGAYSGIGTLGQYNLGGQNTGLYQDYATAGINNPYAGFDLRNTMPVAQQGIQGGKQIAGAALGQLPDAQALMALGFDPQNALYNQLQNQNQQQTLAMLNQSGVGSTPYGQGVADQSNQNFNIQWQNQQLQRALQGAQGAGNLMTNIGQNFNTGLNTATTGAQLPYSTYQGINSNQLGILGQEASFGQQASAIPQQQIQDYLAYLQGGTGQQQANNQTAQVGLNQANLAFNQSQAFGKELGQGLSGIAKGWGTAFGTGS